jgi:hypothetical protein
MLRRLAEPAVERAQVQRRFGAGGVEVGYGRDANGDHRFEVSDNGVGFD